MKIWKPGKADEIWKLMICARDAARTDELLDCMMGILTDAGSDRERGLSEMRAMSGQQIIDGLLAYKQRAYESVMKAFPHGPHR